MAKGEYVKLVAHADGLYAESNLAPTATFGLVCLWSVNGPVDSNYATAAELWSWLLKQPATDAQEMEAMREALDEVADRAKDIKEALREVLADVEVIASMESDVRSEHGLTERDA